MKQCITIPSGKRVSIPAYCAAWKSLKAAHPDTEVKGWNWYPTSPRDILAQISYGVHDRINKHLPWKRHIKSNVCAIYKPKLP